MWRRVMASVRPRPDHSSPPGPVATPPPATPSVTRLRERAAKAPAPLASSRAAPRQAGPGTTLDGRWDKRLAAGAVQPETRIDMHGHTLDTAYALLDSALERAIRRGDRVLLLITGKPPRAESEQPHTRGRIRAAVADWLAASRHAGQIAAVRAAHPRHGGAGALYVILRRSRSGEAPIY